MSQLRHLIDGDEHAPTLVFLNSLGGRAEMWNAQVAGLHHDLRLLRLDYRADPPPGQYSIGDIATDVQTLLTELGEHRVNLCGISLGGMTAMWLAAHVPDLVDRLVLMCTAARMGSPEAWRERAEAVSSGQMPQVAEVVVGRAFTEPFARAHAHTVDIVRQMLLGAPVPGYVAACGALERADLRALLPTIRVPTLVIAGAEDPTAPPVNSEYLVQQIPGAHLVVLDDARHLANIEQATRVNELLREFLAGGAND